MERLITKLEMKRLSEHHIITWCSCGDMKKKESHENQLLTEREECGVESAGTPNT